MINIKKSFKKCVEIKMERKATGETFTFFAEDEAHCKQICEKLHELFIVEIDNVFERPGIQVIE